MSCHICLQLQKCSKRITAHLVFYQLREQQGRSAFSSSLTNAAFLGSFLNIISSWPCPSGPLPVSTSRLLQFSNHFTVHLPPGGHPCRIFSLKNPVLLWLPWTAPAVSSLQSLLATPRTGFKWLIGSELWFWYFLPTPLFL